MLRSDCRGGQASVQRAPDSSNLYRTTRAGNSQPITNSNPDSETRMTIVLYGLATFAVLFGGGILGLLLGRVLPEEYHSDATQKVIQTATGMISLLTALVLGLLVATAKNKFDLRYQ
jgi:hypothetical protein